MTRQDRIIKRIIHKCSIISTIAFIALVPSMMWVCYEGFTYEPFSTFPIVVAVASWLAICIATWIGKTIEDVK